MLSPAKADPRDGMEDYMVHDDDMLKRVIGKRKQLLERDQR